MQWITFVFEENAPPICLNVSIFAQIICDPASPTEDVSIRFFYESFQIAFPNNLGPYSWKILVLRVAPSNTILRKFLEMWVFPLKFKEKILVKKKIIQKAS